MNEGELSKRIDDLRADMNTRFGELREDTNTRFTIVDKRFKFLR